MTIQPGLDIADFCREHRVKFVRKDDSRLMRFIAFFLGAGFMTRFWTTIGRTVYYPTTGTPQESPVWSAYLEQHRSTVEHELIHVQQFRRLWHLHSVFYLLGLPLPFLFAWYRWRSEREAYLHQMRFYCPKPADMADDLWLAARIEVVVGLLWKVYGWCWPRGLMRRWFLRELGR